MVGPIHGLTSITISKIDDYIIISIRSIPKMRFYYTSNSTSYCCLSWGAIAASNPAITLPVSALRSEDIIEIVFLDLIEGLFRLPGYFILDREPKGAIVCFCEISGHFLISALHIIFGALIKILWLLMRIIVSGRLPDSLPLCCVNIPRNAGDTPGGYSLSCVSLILSSSRLSDDPLTTAHN